MRGEREVRTCISYLDEVNAYDNIPNKIFTSIISLTALKSTYIDGLENEWKNLRKKYNVKQGQYLHFTDIKKLLKNPTEVDDNIKEIFLSTDNRVDYEKLYNFYIDALNIIKDNDFIIQATGIFTLNKSKCLPKYIGTNSKMYQLFREHLDRIAFYLVNLIDDDIEARRKVINNKRNNPEVRWYKTKLRYDGDEELPYYSDLRNAFSHCLVDGTKHFNSQSTKKLFDNLKFISKTDVAACTNCLTECGYEIVSHAGSEIIDFIALYVARNMWSELFRKVMIEELGKSKDDVNRLITTLTSINIPGFDPIFPIEYIYDKLYFTEDIARYKIIEDYPF